MPKEYESPFFENPKTQGHRRSLELPTVVGALALAATASLFARHTPYLALLINGSIQDTIPGCQDTRYDDGENVRAYSQENSDNGEFTTEHLTQHEIDVLVESELTGRESTVQAKELSEINILGTIDDIKQVLEYEQDRYTDSDTGITYVLHSDKPDYWTLNEEDFKTLIDIYYTYTEDEDTVHDVIDDYDHSVMRQNMNCLKVKIYKDRAFDGEVVSIAIPSDFTKTFSSMRLQQVPWEGSTPATAEEWSEYNTHRQRSSAASGLAPPKISFGLSFAGIDLTSWAYDGVYIGFAPGAANASQAMNSMANLLPHENFHATLAMNGGMFSDEAVHEMTTKADLATKKYKAMNNEKPLLPFIYIGPNPNPHD